MRILICDGPRSIGESAAHVLGGALRRRRRPTLGIATGSSPLEIYGAFARGIGIEDLDLSRLRAFALDEYVGIADDHPERYANVVDREVTTKLGLDPANVSVPDGASSDPDAAAERYERQIEDAGGIDAQILGVGTNGHIGFNEPGSPHDSRTRVVSLTAETRAANARFFDDISHVPTHAVTQGVGTIMGARTIVMVAQGEAKAEAVRHIIDGEVSTRWPGSILQRHPDVTIVLDEAAGHLLEFAGQYRTDAGYPA